MNKLVPAVPGTLWHYTCVDHGHPGIYGKGLLKPGADNLIWLTDLAEPARDAIGLTRVSMNCDRGAIRYRVDDTTEVVSWMAFRQGIPREMRDVLETFPGVLPRHWFVSWQPTLKATYDPY